MTSATTEVTRWKNHRHQLLNALFGAKSTGLTDLEAHFAAGISEDADVTRRMRELRTAQLIEYKDKRGEPIKRTSPAGVSSRVSFITPAGKAMLKLWNKETMS